MCYVLFRCPLLSVADRLDRPDMFPFLTGLPFNTDVNTFHTKFQGSMHQAGRWSQALNVLRAAELSGLLPDSAVWCEQGLLR